MQAQRQRMELVADSSSTSTVWELLLVPGPLAQHRKDDGIRALTGTKTLMKASNP